MDIHYVHLLAFTLLGRRRQNFTHARAATTLYTLWRAHFLPTLAVRNFTFTRLSCTRTHARARHFAAQRTRVVGDCVVPLLSPSDRHNIAGVLVRSIQ